MATLTLSTSPVNRMHHTYEGTKRNYEQWEVDITAFDKETETFTYTTVRKLSVNPVRITDEMADILNVGMQNTRGANFLSLWIPVE